MPGPGSGSDLALRHALGIDTYDIYCGLASQLVAVDEDAVAGALSRLIQNPALRLRLGESGRRRAREVFDWPVVLKSYRDLWGELALRRGTAARGTQKKQKKKRGKETKATPPGWPARPDPFQAFATYPTHRIGPKSRIGRGSVPAADLTALRRLAMVEFAKAIQPPSDIVEKILDCIPPGGETTAREINNSLIPHDFILVARALAWLAKMGIIKIIT
jgi:hypothetical protein